MSWKRLAWTKALEQVPSASFSLSHHSCFIPSGGYGVARLLPTFLSLTRTGGRPGPSSERGRASALAFGLIGVQLYALQTRTSGRRPQAYATSKRRHMR